MAQRQVNVRLDDEEFERFWAAAFVEGRSLPEELRAAVRSHLDAFADNAHFKAALAARLGREDEKSDLEPKKVSSLDEKRKRARRSDA